MSLKVTVDRHLRQRIGKRCRRARVGLAMTAREVAEKVEMSTVAVYMLENGTSGPSVETLAKLCTLYNVSADWLLGLID